MRVESTATSITWIPSEAIEGMPKMPFELGVAHYDEPPPDVIDDVDVLRERDAFREANELHAWIDVDGGGRITDYGQQGRGLIGVTRLKVGPKTVAFPAVKFDPIQPEPEVGRGWVRFTHTAGGRMGLPAPRRVRGKPFFQVASASAWTTIQLVLYASGEAKASLVGASPFPRHWLYQDGRLVEKSSAIDFEKWYRESFGENTPWGGEDTPAFTTAVESALEREISWQLMRDEEKMPRRRIEPGETLVEQGEVGRDLFLVLDGLFDVEVDGEPVAQIGPGAVVGELAVLEGGERTATLRAVTACRVAVLSFDRLDERALAELAAGRRRGSET